MFEEKRQLFHSASVYLADVSFVGEGIDSTAVRSDAWHHLSDAITSAFAFVGISIASWTRNSAADDWAALCASPVIMFNAWQQLRAPFAELLDTAPAPRLEQEVRSVASTASGVIGLEKCHVSKMGFAITLTCISSSKEL